MRPMLHERGSGGVDAVTFIREAIVNRIGLAVAHHPRILRQLVARPEYHVVLATTTRGVKLSSYAAWWIRAYMLRFILNNWRLVKIGTTQAQRRLFFNLNKEKARHGESRQASRTSKQDISSGRRGGLRSGKGGGGQTRDQLYNEAKKLGIEGRSRMSKS